MQERFAYRIWFSSREITIQNIFLFFFSILFIYLFFSSFFFFFVSYQTHFWQILCILIASFRLYMYNYWQIKNKDKKIFSLKIGYLTWTSIIIKKKNNHSTLLFFFQFNIMYKYNFVLQIIAYKIRFFKQWKKVIFFQLLFI